MWLSGRQISPEDIDLVDKPIDFDLGHGLDCCTASVKKHRPIDRVLPYINLFSTVCRPAVSGKALNRPT